MENHKNFPPYDSYTESFFNAVNSLDICGWPGFTLNPTKFTFSKALSHLLDLKSPIWQSAPLEKISRIHSESSSFYQPHWHAFMVGSHSLCICHHQPNDVIPAFEIWNQHDWTNDQDLLFQESKSISLGGIEKDFCIFDKTKPNGLTIGLSMSSIDYWLFQKLSLCSGTGTFFWTTDGKLRIAWICQSLFVCLLSGCVIQHSC